MMARSIAVFAHNEAGRIIACLDSVKKAIRAGDECIVLNNGSSDDTANLVAGFARDNPFCILKDINLGDKSNAWNVYVHELQREADVFIFLDGDCTLQPDALDELELCLCQHLHANAAAALPAQEVGKVNRRQLLKEGGLAGNLYALSKEFVGQLRRQQVRLPTGLIGDDSLVGALAYWDLEPRQGWDRAKIVTAQRAAFSYTPLSCLSLQDIRLYYRRKIRYSLRRIQIEMMKPLLKEHGLAGIPRDIAEVYAVSKNVIVPRRMGVDAWFDYLAARLVKKSLARNNA